MVRNRHKKQTTQALPVIFIVTVSVLLFRGALTLGAGGLPSVMARLAGFSAMFILPEGAVSLSLSQTPALQAVPDPMPAQNPAPEVTIPQDPLIDISAILEIPSVSDAFGVSAAIQEIPAQYRGVLLEEKFAGVEGLHLRSDYGFLFNDTRLSDESVLSILETPMELRLEGGGPHVLIIHTHATEAFEPYDNIYYDKRYNWRSDDNNKNMVRVGAELASALESLGIGVIHDTTQHDNPSYGGSYDRSAQTIKKYLEQYPSVKVVIDLHRDAIERDGDVIVKPAAEVDGQKAAQIMIVSGCDDGTMDMPEWRSNLRFAAALQNALENRAPGLTRPILFCYRRYNMHLSPGALLIEIGSSANTLDEALYSARLLAQSLAELLG